MYQKVVVVGNLGRDPESRESGSGMVVTKFSVAVNEKRGDTEHTEWFRVVAFGKLAELCARYLTKGRGVVVEGKMKTSSYDKDGETRYSTELLADQVRFLHGGGSSPTSSPSPGPDEDIPF